MSMPERQSEQISVRLDPQARRALAELQKDGASRSEAIRTALLEAARARRSRLLAEEAAAIRADPEERKEAREVLAFMEELRRDPW